MSHITYEENPDSPIVRQAKRIRQYQQGIFTSFDYDYEVTLLIEAILDRKS